MHQRLHERNSKKLSIIGISLTDFFLSNKNFDQLEFNKLLQLGKKDKINFISVPYQNKQILSNLLSWESETNYRFIKSILVDPFNKKSNSKTDANKEKSASTKFKVDLVKQVHDLIKLHGLSQIDFLSLFYSPNMLDTIEKFNKQIARVKETNLVVSIGVHCYSLAQALLACKKIAIDHLEINVDINSSMEVVHSIFKIAHEKQIAVFCFLNTEFKSTKTTKPENLNPLQELMDEGRDTVHNKIIKSLALAPEDFPTLVLRKYVELEFQSILVKKLDITEEKIFFKALTHPYLTNDEQLVIQNSLQPFTYESPKNK